MSTIALVVCPECQGEGVVGMLVCDSCLGTRRIAVDKDATGAVPAGFVGWVDVQLPMPVRTR